MSDNKRIGKISPLQEFRDKPSKSVDSNQLRICQDEDCNTRLSKYNFSNFADMFYRKSILSLIVFVSSKGLSFQNSVSLRDVR